MIVLIISSRNNPTIAMQAGTAPATSSAITGTRVRSESVLSCAPPKIIRSRP